MPRAISIYWGQVKIRGAEGGGWLIRNATTSDWGEVRHSKGQKRPVPRPMEKVTITRLYLSSLTCPQDDQTTNIRWGVRSQSISGNGGRDNYGRGEKVSDPKMREIGD
jgi:hypothetical protein